MPVHLEDESDILVSLFTRVSGATGLLLIAVTTIRGAHGNKSWDKVGFALSVIAGLLAAIWYLGNGALRQSRWALVVCVGVSLWGVAAVERASLTTIFWEGFGWSVLLLSIPVAILLIPVAQWIRESRTRALVMALVVTPLAVFDLLSLIRDSFDFANAPNNAFALNEMLAPAAGRIPGANFVPQYTNLLGWVLVPFRHLVSANVMVNVATIVMSSLGVTAVLLGVYLSSRCLPPRSLWLAVLVTVPLATVTVLHDPVSSSIGSYFQELPLRMFPAMLCTLVAVRVLDGLLRGVVRQRSLVVFGALAGLVAWDSQDIGVVLIIAAGIVLQLGARGSLRRRTTLMWLLGVVPGLLVYPLWTLSTGHSLNFQYLALTARSFGSGFGAALMQVPGPVLLVLPVLLGSAVVGLCLLWKSSGGATELASHERLAVATLAFVSLWSVGFFPYYLNRSYASGQLQVFLLPLSLCCCSLLPVGLSSQRRGAIEPRFGPRAFLKGHSWWLVPITLPVAVAVASIVQSPNPVTTWRELAHSTAQNTFVSQLVESEGQSAGSGWPGSPGSILHAQVTDEIALLQAYVKSHGGGSIGYVGPNSNYLKLLSGVQPRLLYDDVADNSLGNTAYRLGCSFLLHNPTTWLMTAPNASTVIGSTMCGAYESVPLPKELPGTIFKLRVSVSPTKH